MRGTFVILVLTLALAQPALAACGPTGCVINQGCPKGSITPGKSIQATIKAAGCNSTVICVKPGTYNGKIDFLGKPITLVSSGGPTVTFLNGGGTGPVVTFKTSEGPDSILDGFTVMNGSAQNGGGIFINNASPTIRNSIIRNNIATGASGGFSRGGGVWVGGASSRPSITCSRIQSNSATYGGGGLATTGSADPFLRRDHFEANSAPYGGAISTHPTGRLDVASTSFFSNRATDGGAIHSGVVYGNALIRQSWFRGNTATSNGGAIWVPAGLAEVVNCTFEGNRASNGGAIADGYGSMVSVSSSVFVNNTTTGGGSAALANTHPAPSNTALVNHYNDFFGNVGGDSLNTYGNVGLLAVDPVLNQCCATAGVINLGIPDFHFNDANATRNDMGACGGPTIP